MKKQSNLKRLMGYAGKHRFLTYASWVLSALSAWMALIPFWYIWKIIQEVLDIAPYFDRGAKPDLSRMDGGAVCHRFCDHLHCGPDVLSHGGLSYCSEYSLRGHASYRSSCR